MTSFGPKKNSSCCIFPGAQKSTLSPNTSLLILFSFSLTCTLLTHFLIYFLWIAQWAASFLESQSLLGDAVWKQERTLTPRPSAAKKSPLCNPVCWVRTLRSACQQCSGPINTQAFKECSWHAGWQLAEWFMARWGWKAAVPIQGWGSCFSRICHLATS